MPQTCNERCNVRRLGDLAAKYKSKTGLTDSDTAVYDPENGEAEDAYAANPPTRCAENFYRCVSQNGRSLKENG